MTAPGIAAQLDGTRATGGADSSCCARHRGDRLHRHRARHPRGRGIRLALLFEPGGRLCRRPHVSRRAARRDRGVALGTRDALTGRIPAVGEFDPAASVPNLPAGPVADDGSPGSNRHRGRISGVPRRAAARRARRVADLRAGTDRSATAAIGALAALLLASSPIFLYQLVQPMGDVPAMTWWLAAAVLLMRRTPAAALFAGLAAAAAIVTRPNLVPLAAVLGIYAARTSWRQSDGVRGRRPRPGSIVIASLNVMRYGSWASTGYGSTAALFSVGNIVPNLIRYPVWLLGTHTPFLALAAAAPWLACPPAGSPRQSPAARSDVRSGRGPRTRDGRGGVRVLPGLRGLRRVVVFPLPAARAAVPDRSEPDGSRRARCAGHSDGRASP